MIYYNFPYSALLKRRSLTERSFVKNLGLSRCCVRSVAQGQETCALKSIWSVAKSLGCQLQVLVSSESGLPDFSVAVISMKIHRDGFESWKIHLMDFVDEYRRTLDPTLFLLGPVHGVDQRIKALLASTVQHLCMEVGVPNPAWSETSYYLERPWFLSGMRSLQASALLESPLSFRRNNIFAHVNFLDRV